MHISRNPRFHKEPKRRVANWPPDQWVDYILFLFPVRKPIKMLMYGAFRYDAHGDDKQKYFFSLSINFDFDQFRSNGIIIERS